eukprot:TRINITY_DN3149_c0_g2_i1.p1 TRINITY_DN3149_c0_g2~~TRINITY_DN3149_c0_g2_i1.p1  ORF type:complete len:406 (+),score=61.24 TRINITY_DN3149_c0_g2_i1:1034-2251(+)
MRNSQDTIFERMEATLQIRNEGKEIWNPHDHDLFVEKIKMVERKHPQKRTGVKIGIIYARPGQTQPKDMFQNGMEGGAEVSDAFWTFMKGMGNKIDLTTWKGYRGDMGAEGVTYHEKWQHDVNVIYHVSPLLNSEEHRRLVGNDVAIIFFYDNPDGVIPPPQFDPSEIAGLGTVPQVFAVVQPVTGSTYRVAFFNNVNVKHYGPQLPAYPIMLPQLKELVLAKMYNGLVMTTYCPPLNRLYFIPRNETLISIVDEFPPESRKNRQARIKSGTIRVKRSRGALNAPLTSKRHSRAHDDTETIKGDFWMSQNNSKKLDESKQGTRSYLTIQGNNLVVLDYKTRSPLQTFPILQVGKCGLKTPKTLLFEVKDGASRSLILFKCSSATSLGRFHTNLNTTITSLYSQSQ